MAPAPPQRKSIGVMGWAAKALSHGCLPGEGKGGGGGTARRFPTICVWRDTAKRQSLFTPLLEKTQNISKLNISSFKTHLATDFSKLQHHYVLIALFSALKALVLMTD